MRFAARNDLEPSSWKMGINFIVETSLAIARWMATNLTSGEFHYTWTFLSL